MKNIYIYIYIYIKTFSSETNLQKEAEYQKQFRTYRINIFNLLRWSKNSYHNGIFQENKRNVKTVWKAVKKLINIKQTNELPSTTLQIGKKTDPKEIANHFNGYFSSIAGELNEKVVKSKNMHLSYLGSIKESNMFLTKTTPNDMT